MDKELTVVIPTYNREQALRETLQALSGQAEISRVRVVVSDNASTGDIRGLCHVFEDRLDIRYVRFPVNTSGLVNTSAHFLYAETDWVWLLGDDDLPLEGGVKKILDDIKAVDERVTFIKYSIGGGGFLPYPDSIVGSAGEFVRIFRNRCRQHPGMGCVFAGDCLFMSTCVMNVKRLSPWISNSFFYCYNHQSFYVPALYALKDGGRICFSSFRVVQNITPSDPKMRWSVRKFLLGLCSWNDMDIDISFKDRRWFVRFLAFDINPDVVVSELDGLADRKYARYLLFRIFHEAYGFGIMMSGYLVFSTLVAPRVFRKVFGRFARWTIMRTYRNL